MEYISAFWRGVHSVAGDPYCSQQAGFFGGRRIRILRKGLSPSVRECQNLYVWDHSTLRFHYADQHCTGRPDRSGDLYCDSRIHRNDDMDRNGAFDPQILCAPFQSDQYHSGPDVDGVHLEHTEMNKMTDRRKK